MDHTLKEKLFCIFNIFMLVLTVIFTAVIFFESIYVIRTGEFLEPFQTILCTLAVCGAFAVLYKLLFRYKELLLKLEWPLITALSIIYFLALFWFGNRLIIVPEYDLDFVQDSALMIADGDLASAWGRDPYFANFTNQIPLALLLALFYRIGFLLGFSDYYIIGNFFNALSISIAMFLCYKLSRKHFSIEAALTIYVFLILDPIWFLYVSWTSTDTFCLPFLMGGLCLLDESLGGRLRLGRVFAGFFLIFISFTIRATGIILVIAYFIFMVSKYDWKMLLKALFLAATAFLLCTALYHGICRYYGAPYDTDERLPASHWLMIGSNEESWGEFSSEDYERSLGLSGYEERSKVSREVFADRISSMFPLRLIKHCLRKMAETWSSGYCIETTWQSVRAPGRVFDYAVGAKSAVIQYICQSKRVLLYGCLLFLAAYRLIKGKREIRFLLTAWLGAIGFYLLWEAGQRYSLCFVPWMSIAAGEVLCIVFKPAKNDS